MLNSFSFNKKVSLFQRKVHTGKILIDTEIHVGDLNTGITSKENLCIELDLDSSFKNTLHSLPNGKVLYSLPKVYEFAKFHMKHITNIDFRLEVKLAFEQEILILFKENEIPYLQR